MNFLQKILDRSIQNKYLFGISLGVHRNDESWFGVSGNLNFEDSYFIASTTKLFVSSLIFKLRNSGKLSFDTKISKFLSGEILSRLHYLKGKEHSYNLTIKNLLAHTSGLPDYFKNKSFEGKTLQNHLIQGEDLQWDFNQVIAWTRNMNPQFEPLQSQKAYYSDTNYQLLGKIIENVYECALEEVIQELICNPLGLTQTYLFTDPLDLTPHAMYYKTEALHIPKAMTSFRADGGVVSTTKELMMFLQGFINGKLFPVSYLEEIQVWNRIFFPLESGIGIQRFMAPW